MKLTEDDWRLITELWDERDKMEAEFERLRGELVRLRSMRKSLRTQMRTIRDAMDSVSRDRSGLTDVKIAEKFGVDRYALYDYRVSR